MPFTLFQSSTSHSHLLSVIFTWVQRWSSVTDSLLGGFSPPSPPQTGKPSTNTKVITRKSKRRENQRATQNLFPTPSFTCKSSKSSNSGLNVPWRSLKIHNSTRCFSRRQYVQRTTNHRCVSVCLFLFFLQAFPSSSDLMRSREQHINRTWRSEVGEFVFHHVILTLWVSEHLSQLYSFTPVKSSDPQQLWLADKTPLWQNQTCDMWIKLWWFFKSLLRQFRSVFLHQRVCGLGSKSHPRRGPTGRLLD